MNHTMASPSLHPIRINFPSFTSTLGYFLRYLGICSCLLVQLIIKVDLGSKVRNEVDLPLFDKPAKHIKFAIIM